MKSRDRETKLFEAILNDDRAGAKAALANDSRALANAIVPIAFCPSAIAHWIYAGDTALHIAAAAHHVEIAKILLEAGADPNTAGYHRRSMPLHYAADGSLKNPNWNPIRQVGTIQLLLDSGAELQAQDKNGATPLHRAVRTRCAAAVKCLLEAGANPTALNKPGSTPFHLAVQNTGRGGSGTDAAKAAQHAIITAFLKKGVSPKIRDLNGKSVIQWAKTDSIRQLLDEK